jgi:CheY-like chemotaxis protein
MKILIVDDDDITRTMLRATLQSMTGEIKEAANGLDALRVAREWRPDVVILDVMMPGSDGYEICYAIKTAPELRRTRVIMHTARSDTDGVETGRAALADAYLLKPFDPDKLIAAVKEARHGLPGEFPGST